MITWGVFQRIDAQLQILLSATCGITVSVKAANTARRSQPMLHRRIQYQELSFVIGGAIFQNWEQLLVRFQMKQSAAFPWFTQYSRKIEHY